MLKKVLLGLFIVLLAGVWWVRLSLETTSSSTPKRPSVVCTTGMIADAVEAIAGDVVTVTHLMGPGVDPHLYRATEGDIRRLTKADIIFFNGIHLEAKMSDVLKKLGQKQVSVPVAEVLPKEMLLDFAQYEGQYDPHVWFDVDRWGKVVTKIQTVLADRYPEHREAIMARGDDYRAQLTALHQAILKDVSHLNPEQRVLVTAHDAFSYFGQAYGFTVRGLQGIGTESKAGTKDIQNLANYIVDKQIRAVFVESSVPVRTIKAVQQAAKAKGWDVKIGGELFSDAMGMPGTPEGTYQGMVKHNVVTILSALSETAPTFAVLNQR